MSQNRARVDSKSLPAVLRLGMFGMALLGCIWMGLVLWPDSEPTYQGQKLSSWLSQQQEIASHEAEMAIRAIGTNGLPFLLRELQARPSKMVRLLNPLVRVYDSEFLVRAYSECWERRSRALAAFAILGTRAAPAIPELTELVPENHRAARALSAIGSPALPALFELLNHPVPRVQRVALSALAAIQEQAALDALLGIAQANHPLKKEALKLLAHRKDSLEQVLPLLLNHSFAVDPEVRFTALYALGKLGACASNGIPRLLLLRDHGDHELSLAAHLTIEFIQPGVASKSSAGSAE